MADSSPNYTVSALLEPAHIGAFLLLLVVFGAALGLTGVGLVVALEVAYLLLVPRMIPYQRRVRVKHAQAQLMSATQARELRAANLSREVRQRYQRLSGIYTDLMRLSADLPLPRSEVESLMDAAVDLSLAMESHARAEREEPLATLRQKATSDPAAQLRLGQREQDQAHAQQLSLQLAEVEKSLSQLLQLAQTGKLGEVTTRDLGAELDIAARTAREMAELNLKDPGR